MTQAITFLFHALFFFTPLILSPKNSEVFEFPKMLFVYAITVLITSAWILDWIKHKKIVIRRTPLDIPILIFLLIQILATVFSIDPYTSLWGYYSRFHGGLASTISYIILYYAFVSNVKGRTFDMINTLLLSTALISVYAILEHFGIDKKFWVQDVQSRVFSTLGQPNWLSAYLVAVLPISVFLYLKKYKIHYLLLSLLIIVSVIFTKSQSGLAAMSLVLFVILVSKSSRASRIILLVSIIPILFILKPKPLASLNNINPFYSTTNQIVKNDLDGRNAGSNSMVIRRVVWQGAIDLAKKHPILGTGVETFGYSYYWTRPAAHNLLSEWDFLYNKAHNEYLNFLANSGILGLVSYLLLIVWTIKWWPKNNFSEVPSTALLIGWLSILITNFFGFSVVAVGLLFFIFPAFAVASNNSKAKYLKIKLTIRPTLPCLAIGFGTFFLLSSIYKVFSADLNYNLGKTTANLSLLQKAVNLQPRQPLFLAKLAEEQAKTAAAIFLQLENLPNDAKQAQQQYQQQALENIRRAVGLNKYNLNSLKSQARVEIYLSNIDPQYQTEALNTIIKASLLAPTDAKLIYNIGLIYETLGQKPQAKTAYQKALELKPNYPDPQLRLNRLQP